MSAPALHSKLRWFFVCSLAQPDEVVTVVFSCRRGNPEAVVP
jgi:hypothetical protein